MNTHHRSSWQDAEVARRFLDERRGAIPFAFEQLEMLLQLLEHFHHHGEPARILDLGCGDGILARTVLLRYPDARAVLLDHSRAMLARAHKAMLDFLDRCEIVYGDMTQPLAAAVSGPFDVVLSGYAIHHLPSARKRALYEEIYHLLAPGGLFAHVEHVASATLRGQALFDRLYIDHLTAQAGKPREHVEAEYHARPDKAENKLEPVDRQLGWLREIGFAEVDCYFKWLELAVFAGQRPRG